MIFGDLSTLLNLQKCSHFSLICLINGPTLAFLVIYDNNSETNGPHQRECLLVPLGYMSFVPYSNFLSALYVNLSAWINL